MKAMARDMTTCIVTLSDLYDDVTMRNIHIQPVNLDDLYHPGIQPIMMISNHDDVVKGNYSSIQSKIEWDLTNELLDTQV